MESSGSKNREYKSDLLDDLHSLIKKAEEISPYLSKGLSLADYLIEVAKSKNPEDRRAYLSSALKKGLDLLSKAEENVSPEERRKIRCFNYLLRAMGAYMGLGESTEEKTKKQGKNSRILGLIALILIPLGLFSLFSFSSPTGFFVFSSSSSSIFFLILFAIIAITIAIVYKLRH